MHGRLVCTGDCTGDLNRESCNFEKAQPIVNNFLYQDFLKLQYTVYTKGHLFSSHVCCNICLCVAFCCRKAGAG